MPVYKYLSPERTLVLEDATLRATQANALNDPFELKPFFASLLEKSDLQAGVSDKFLFEEELRKAYVKQPPALRAKLPFKKLLALSKQQGFKQQLEAMLGYEIDKIVDNHLPALTEDVRSLLHDKLGNLVGIVSFSEMPNESLMWAHYANDHKGFAVEFDDMHEFFDRRRNPQDEFFHLRAVEYHETLPAYAKIAELDGTKLLCVKQAKWRHERERRMLIPVDPQNYQGSGEPVHLISFPRGAVTAVVFGARASSDLVGAIQAILSSHDDYRHVMLRKARADLSAGEIVIDDLLSA